MLVRYCDVCDNPIKNTYRQLKIKNINDLIDRIEAHNNRGFLVEKYFIVAADICDTCMAGIDGLVADYISKRQKESTKWDL